MSRTIGLNIPSFIVDSKDREHGTNEDFTYTLQVQPGHRFNNVALVGAMIPMSFYSAQSNHGNLTFTLSEDGSTQTIEIPEGNYNSNSFSFTIKRLLEAASVLMGHAYIYTISFPDPLTEPQTYKYKFTVSNNGGVQPSFIFDDASFRVSEFMGFLDNTTNTFIGDTITSYKPVKFKHTSHITIRSTISRNGGSSNEDSAILARIPVPNITDNINGYPDIVYNLSNLEDATRIMTNTNSNTFHFALYDDKDRLINLNNHSWHCTIMLYEYNNSSELIINDLRIKYLENPSQESVLLQEPGIESTATLEQEEKGLVKKPKPKKK